MIKILDLYTWFSMHSHKYKRLSKDLAKSSLGRLSFFLHLDIDDSHLSYIIYFLKKTLIRM
jgi:hypothetical protein